MYNSRLQRRQEKSSKRQSILLIGGSVIILWLFIAYGFPAILNLTGVISGLKSQKTAITQKVGPAPMTPRFSQNFDATKSATITLSGVADPKVSVEIFQNERSLGNVLVKDDGTFTMEVDLARGGNIFTAAAISESGTKSEISNSYIVSYLATAPKLEVTNPKDGDSVKDTQVTVSGKTDPGVSVAVNDHFAIVGNDGSFNYTFNLSDGENKIKVVASDRAGNQTTKELKVTK